MKYFFAVALLATVASARFLPADQPASQAQIQEILEAINSPSTDPGTAIMLKEMLLEMLGIGKPGVPHPVLPGPALVEFPEESLIPAPIAPAPPASSSPLVQIIVNVQGQSAPAAPQEEKPDPVIVVDEPEVVADPVIVVDEAPVEPVIDGPEILN